MATAERSGRDWSQKDSRRLERALLSLGRGERNQAGEPAGLSDVYELMGRAMLTTAYVITGNREDAEDILQDALVEVFLDARQYRPRTNPRAWVLTVTRHTALDAVRKRARRATAPEEAALAVPAPGDAEGEFAALWDMLAALKAEEREIVVLRLYHCLSYREIADTLHLSVAAAQKRYQRAIDRLREHHGVKKTIDQAKKGDRYEQDT